LEKRHQTRYQNLVESHLKTSQGLATASHAKLGTASSFAATQAAWRFYAHEKTTLSKLSEPLVAASCDSVTAHCMDYALIVHDWSVLNYWHHDSKLDRKDLRGTACGYELQSSIVLSDSNGQPLGVLAQNLTTQNGVWSSYQGDEIQAEKEHLQELAQRVQWLEKQIIDKKPVHIIDREGDAVEWLRACPNSQWLIRCRKTSTVIFEDKKYKIQELAQQMDSTSPAREVRFRGKTAYQTIADCPVTITRPAQPKRQAALIKGDPIAARLVVSRIMDAHGKLLAEWYLLSNAPVSAQTLATWYYWRWQIECFFKLLKQQGLQLEDWQQETGLAIAKRLLIASQACVLVWQLQYDDTPQAHDIKHFLVRLSGRQMKKNRPITPSALFEGLWLFLTLMDTLDHYPLDQLRQFKQFVDAFWTSQEVV
jgi:IS4 transposase